MEIHFAPLQGYTDLIYRNTFQQFFGGVDYYYTPFMRIGKKGEIRQKDLRDIQSVQNDTRVVVPQVLAGNTRELGLLLEAISSQGYQHADINLGCPFPMVVKSGRGSGLLAHPAVIEELLDEACQFSELKISLKIRLGLQSPDELLNLWPLLEKYPLCHVTIHARTTKQQYKGNPYKDHFDTIYKKTKVPLIYNGDLCTLEDVNNVKAQFPLLKGVMIGRGLLQNPYLANQIKSDLLSTEDRNTLFAQFHDALLLAYSKKLEGNSHLLMKMKTVWDYLLPNADKKIKKQIAKAQSIAQYERACVNVFKYLNE